MKKFLLRMALFGGLLITILIVLTFCIKPQTGLYTYSYINKMERLDSLRDPRLIFVGGSNVAFGINSPMISDSLKVNVHNAAVHAGIGLKFMLEDLESHLHKGDEVVIMPEWQQFASNYCGQNESLTDVVVFEGPSSWYLLNPQQWVTVISSLPKHINNKFMFRITPHQFNYTSSGFNDYGDEVSHYNYPHKNFQLTPGKDKMEESYITSFLHIIKRLEENGIKVHLLPPVMAQSAYELNKELINSIENRLQQENIHFEVRSERHVFPDSLTFDTPYHMGKTAVDSLSKLIITELRNEY